MHEMFVGHDEQGGLIPGRCTLFMAGDPCVPTASLAPHFERFHSIPCVRQVRGVDGTSAPRLQAAEGLVLQRADE